MLFRAKARANSRRRAGYRRNAVPANKRKIHSRPNLSRTALDKRHFLNGVVLNDDVSAARIGALAHPL